MKQDTIKEGVMREALNAERNSLLEQGKQDSANAVAQLLFGGDPAVLVSLYNRIHGRKL